jgi:hypothetical protein
VSLTKDQQDQVIKKIASTIKKSCPSCDLLGKRQLVPEVYLVNAMITNPPPPTPRPHPGMTLAEAARLSASPPPALIQYPNVMPCVSTICSNCGYVEFYNVHRLGLAEALTIPPPGVPIG